MSNFALKYRPRNYVDVVGQEHIVRILCNLQKQNSMPNGLLFHGSRGTGKTTMARILASSLNCTFEYPVGQEYIDGGDSIPCGICDSCKAVQSERSDSVLEIDGASHGLVEDARELREMVRYSHSGKYRVVIIDEAHSCSRAAFNALLKILEEPPLNVLFVLATTEPTKVIDTIRSRLMPFTFKRLSVSEIENRLKFIAEQESISVNGTVCKEIAKYAEGGVRDAIVMFEQLYYFDDKMSQDSFAELFGVVGDKVFEELFITIFEQDRAKAIILLEEFFNRVGERDVFLKGLLQFLKKVLIGLQGSTVDVSSNILSRLTISDTLVCMRKVWDFTLKTRASLDFYSVSAVMLYVEIAEVLQGDIVQKSIPKQLPTKQNIGDFLLKKQKAGLL